MKHYYIFPEDDFEKLRARVTRRKRDIISKISDPDFNMLNIDRKQSCDYETIHKISDRLYRSIYKSQLAEVLMRGKMRPRNHNPYIKIISGDVELAMEKISGIECMDITFYIGNIIEDLLSISEVWKNQVLCGTIDKAQWHQIMCFQALLELVMSDITGRRIRLSDIPEVLSDPKNTVYMCWQYK